MKNFDWDDFWQYFFNLGAALCILVFTIITVVAITDEHKIRGYYLSTNPGSTSGNNPKIVIDINWQPDESIIPERQMSHMEVLQMVDSLNSSLK